MTDDSKNGVVSLDIQNIGGIESQTLEFGPGVTVLPGQNATNRTSTLQAIAAAVGSTKHPTLKGDASEGQVEMEVGDDTYTRALTRTSGRPRFDGNPLLSDPAAADNFAILLKSNPARKAVVQQDGLREVVMEPVNVSKYETALTQKQSRRKELKEEIDQIKNKRERLPQLETDINSLKKEIAEIKDEKSEKKAELAEIKEEIAEAGDDDSNDELERLEQKHDEINDDIDDLAGEINELDTQIQETEDTISKLKRERQDAIDTIEDLGNVSEDELEELKQELRDKREKKSSLDNKHTQLNTVININERIRGEGAVEIVEQIDDIGTGEGTQELYQDLEPADASDKMPEEFTCPTCSQEATREQLKTTISTLKQIRTRVDDEREEIEQDIDKLEKRTNQIEDNLDTLRNAKETKSETKSDIERETEVLENLRESRSETKDRLSDLEAERKELQKEIESVEQEGQEQQEGLHTRRSTLSSEIRDLDRTLSRKKSKIEEKKEEKANLQQVEDKKDELDDELEEVREEIRSIKNTIQNLEEEVISKFNDELETILDILGYNNIEKIELEKRLPRGKDPSGLREEAEMGTFEMRITRTEDGKGYEDHYSNLSESEQEVVGLLFALAGYLAHDVQEDLPFMLLDSVESVDAQRVAALVDYFEQHCEYLVVALLEEDAQALPDSYEYKEEFVDMGDAAPVTS